MPSPLSEYELIMGVEKNKHFSLSRTRRGPLHSYLNEHDGLQG